MIFLIYVASIIVSVFALFFFKLYLYLLMEVPLIVIAYFWNRFLKKRYDQQYPLQCFGRWGKHRTYGEYMENRHRLGHGRWNAEEYSPDLFRNDK